MKVEAFVKRIFKEDDEREGVFKMGVAADSDPGNILMKKERFAMDGSVIVRRIWYDTIYARRHK